MFNDEVQSTLSQQTLNPVHKSKFALTNKSSALAKNRSYSSRALDPTQILKNTEISKGKCSLSKGSNLLHHSFINNSSKKFSTARQDNTSAVQRNKHNKESQQQQQQRTSKSSIKYQGDQNSKISLSYKQNAANQALRTKNEQKLRQQQFISSIQVVQTFEESQNQIVIDHHDDDNDEQKIEKINISSPLQRSLSRSATQKQLRSSESLTDVDRTVIHDDTFCLSKEVADILITPEKIDNIKNLITTNNQYQTNASNNKSFLIMSMTDSKGEVETQLMLQQQITPSSGSDQPEKNDDLNFEQ